MNKVILEHVNITVADPAASAAVLVRLFGWHIRWSGDAIHAGRSVHVGGDSSYVALYSSNPDAPAVGDSYQLRRGLNHIGVVVHDLDQIEARVVAEGFKPHSHSDYEPGRRFYFDDVDGVEYEVLSYD